MPVLHRHPGPLLGLEMLRVAKPRWGGGKEEWDKSGLEGVWGAVLAQRWALCFKSFSGRGGGGLCPWYQLY